MSSENSTRKYVNCAVGVHDFRGEIIFNVFSDNGKVESYGAEVSVHCASCGGLFSFDGMKPIVSRGKPGVSQMGTVAFLPFSYAGIDEYGKVYS